MDILARYEHLPDPVSPLLIAGIAMSTAGAAYSGISAYQQGQAESAQNKYNAELEQQHAKEIEKATEVKQQRQAEEAARAMSTMEAGMGKAGIVSTAGTPLMIQAKQASELELQNLMIGYEGGIEAGQARSQAEIYKMKSKAARQAGMSGLISGGLTAGGTLLAGFSKNSGGKGKQQLIQNPFGLASGNLLRPPGWKGD